MNKEKLEEVLKRTDTVLPIPLARSSTTKALVIDLKSETSIVVDVAQQYLNKYVGGPALGARLWASFAETEADDSLSSEENDPVVITGSSTGNLISVTFRSPATGNLYFNTFSGKFKTEFCAIIICGKLRHPCIAEYSEGNVRFRFSEDFRNMNVSELQDMYPMCIATGKAARQRLLYATCVFNGCSTGRGGLGYVFDSKNLIALSAGFDVVHNDKTDLSSFIFSATVQGWAPVNNFSKRTDPRIFHLSSSETQRKLGKIHIPYDAVLMLGANTGCYDISSVYERYRFCIENGIDYVSLGNILGWLSETQERGIVSFAEPIDFKNNIQLIPFLNLVLDRCGEASVYADGIKAIGDFYGNRKYIREINGLECGPFDYRGAHANALNHALGNWFPVYFELIPKLNIEDKVNLVIYNEELVMGLQSTNSDDASIIPTITESLGSIKKMLINRKIVPFDRLINLEKLIVTDVFTVGHNCRIVVREINAFLKANKQHIPDYFCVDPESNFKTDSIVPIRNLIAGYRKKLAMERS